MLSLSTLSFRRSQNSDQQLSTVLYVVATNCTEPPYPVAQNDLGMSNWTGVDGVDPRPFATQIKYYCRREGWGYPSTGENEQWINCQWDGQWSNDANIETCVSKCCHHLHMKLRRVFLQSFHVQHSHLPSCLVRGLSVIMA